MAKKVSKKEKKSLIPMVDLALQYKVLKPQLHKAMEEVFKSTRFILGPEVATLESRLAEYCETKYAIACGSGTDALQMALMAIGVGPGDEVITTPFTFIATAEVIALLGAKPVFVDIDPDTYCMDPQKIEKAISKKTKAIIPVHLYGQSADMDPILEIAKKRKIFVIEDACQAIGATYKGRKVCSLGEMGCISFFPSKNLGGYGDGGMVLTSDEKLFQILRMIRDHGSVQKYHHVRLGFNSRLDTLQAAILLVKFQYLNSWNKARRKIAEMYTQLLKNAKVKTPIIREGNEHVFHQYTIQVQDRDGLRKHLEKYGISTAVHYPVPLHLQPAFQFLKFKPGQFPIAEEVASRVVSLPMYPELKPNQVRFIAEKIIEFTG